MPDKDPLTERLIAEPLCVRLDIDRTTTQIATSVAVVAAANPPDAPLPPEAARIVDALQKICAAKDAIVLWGDRPHKFVPQHFANADKGTQLIGRPGAARAAHIVIAPVDEPNQHIFAKFAVVPNGKWVPGKPLFFLECEGNPTTLVAGNNVVPVTSRDPKTKKLEPYPSSSRKVMTTLNRLLFRFLQDIAAQITGSDEGLFEQASLEAIDGGDFAISHIQWCCYLRADVSRFLQVMIALFEPPAKTKVGVAKLARQTGLRFDYETDERSTRVTAVTFEKRHGKNNAYCGTFYNKGTRVGHMRQGVTLGADEKALIKDNVRFDMTAHTPGILRIIADARRHLEDHRAYFDQLPEARLAKGFLTRKPRATARWLEFAVFVLSHRMLQGKMRRVSFANYLVPIYRDEVLRLPSIVNVTAECLQALEKLDHPVAKAWREAKSFDTRGWVQRLVKASACDDNVVYACRDKWLATYKVDIEIPHSYYRDLKVISSIIFLDEEEREAHDVAHNQNDAEATLSLIKEAQGKLLGQMKTFIGGPLSTPPILLPPKVIGQIVAVKKQAPTELTGGRIKVARSGSAKSPKKRDQPLKSLQTRRSYPEDIGPPSSEKTLREGIARLHSKLAQTSSTADREQIQREIAAGNQIVADYGKRNQKAKQARREKTQRDRFVRASGTKKPIVALRDID